jgi:uncharacterized protein
VDRSGPYYGHGVDLKPEHYPVVLEGDLDVDWVEVITERFLGVRGGVRLEVLEKVRTERPVALHGLRLSIGSCDPLDRDYLQALSSLVRRVQPAWVSDHLAWSSGGGMELDLLPLPYTEEALAHVVERVSIVQDALGRSILLENPSSYMTFRGSDLEEWEFLSELARRSGCGILLDVNNLYVCARNHGFEARQYLDALPPEHVCQLHLAGHRVQGPVLLDNHEGPVPPCVWDLYREVVRRFGPVSTIVEWDTNVPPWPVLAGESRRAAEIEREVTGETGGDSSKAHRVPLR